MERNSKIAFSSEGVVTVLYFKNPNPYILDVSSNILLYISFFTTAYRKVKGVDLSENFVFVTSDATQMPSHLVKYAFGPTLSVEIKVIIIFF